MKLFLLHSPVFTLVTVIITVHVSFHLLVAGVQLDSHAPLPLDSYMCAHVHVSYVINTLIDLINYDTSITRHQTIIE